MKFSELNQKSSEEESDEEYENDFKGRSEYVNLKRITTNDRDSKTKDYGSDSKTTTDGNNSSFIDSILQKLYYLLRLIFGFLQINSPIPETKNIQFGQRVAKSSKLINIKELFDAIPSSHNADQLLFTCVRVPYDERLNQIKNKPIYVTQCYSFSGKRKEEVCSYPPESEEWKHWANWTLSLGTPSTRGAQVVDLDGMRPTSRDVRF